jgi:hypothetical protein
LGKVGVGGFGKQYYWSIEEISADHAGVFDFYNGSFARTYATIDKLGENGVRAVRSF